MYKIRIYELTYKKVERELFLSNRKLPFQKRFKLYIFYYYICIDSWFTSKYTLSKNIRLSHCMKKLVHCILLFIFCFSFSFSGKANKNSELLVPRKRILISDSLLITDKMHTDTAFVYRRGANGLIEMPPIQWTPFPYNVSFRDTVIYNPAYLPVIFDGKILPSNLDFINKQQPNTATQLHLISEDSTLAPMLKKADDIQRLRRDFYTNMNNIESVRYNAFTLKKLPRIDTEEVTKRNVLHDLITADDAISVEPVELTKIAPKFIFWTYSGEHNFQVAQNFVSDNWYKSGDNTFSVINQHKLTLNYKKDKTSFSNTFEWRLTAMKNQGDKQHDFIYNEDLIRLENTFGYKAFNNWEYTAKLESQTQIFDSYPVNSDKISTAFLSPLIMNFGLGMKFSKEKKFESDKYKVLKFSVNLAPVSINYIYISNDSITKRQGVAADKTEKFELGTTINSDFSFSFNRFTSLSTRFKYFTNYEYASMEFENKLNMQINRYFSTIITMYWRFDDNENSVKEKRLGYFQLNQALSFGLSYKW